jgi:anti-sigma factor RsiW
MDYEAQLKLQAFLDGELPKAEADEVANWLARDREAVALFAELRNTRQALRGTEVGVSLPESREFFWSKIQRQIENSGPPVQAAVRVSILARLQRLLVPAAAMTALVVAAAWLLSARHAAPLETEIAMADSGAFTYHDYSEGTTLVWLAYPAENELTQNDTGDTIN